MPDGPRTNSYDAAVDPPNRRAHENLERQIRELSARLDAQQEQIDTLNAMVFP